MEPGERLGALIAEYHPSDVVIPLDEEGTKEPWLLIEFNTSTQEYYFTFHATPDDAGEYNVTQENTAWAIVKIVNMQSGLEMEPELSLPTWKTLST